MVRGARSRARPPARSRGGEGARRARGVEPAAAVTRAREDRACGASVCEGDGGGRRAARGDRHRAGRLRPRRRARRGRPEGHARARRAARRARRAARPADLPRRPPAQGGASGRGSARRGHARRQGRRAAQGPAVGDQEGDREGEEGRRGHARARASACSPTWRSSSAAAERSAWTRTRRSRWRWPARRARQACGRPDNASGRLRPFRRRRPTAAPNPTPRTDTTSPSARSSSRCARASCPGTPPGPPGPARARTRIASCRRTARRRCR